MAPWNLPDDIVGVTVIPWTHYPTRRMLRRLALAILVIAAAGCDHFSPVEPIAESTGPIPTGMARVRLENSGTFTILETWYTPCLGGAEPLKVRRRVEPGGSSQQDVAAGCVRLTLYPEGSPFYVTVIAPQGEVTTVTI